MYLNIDVNKVLESKQPKIDALTESYEKVCNNQTPLNIINFMSLYKNSSKDTILENLSSLCNINSDISFSYFHNVLEFAEFSETKLNEFKTHIKSIIDSTLDEDYIDRLNKAVEKINAVISKDNEMENIHDEMILKLNCERFKKYCACESYLENDLEVLIYNINTSPETISEYEKIIRKIKVSNTTEYFSSFPMLLVKNTEMIRNLRVHVSGDVLDLLTSMPTVIVDKLVRGKLPHSALTPYLKIFDSQIALLYKDLKNNEPDQYQLYSTYLKKLTDAKLKLMNCKKAIKESIEKLDNSDIESVDENIADMAPDIILYDEGVVEDLIGELEDSIADIIFDPDEEINETKLENFVRLCKTYEATSNIQKKMINAGHQASSKIQKTVSNVRSKMVDAKRATAPIGKALDPVFNLMSNTVNKLKEMDKKERTERIITGNYHLKLNSLIKRGITALAIGATAVGGGKLIGSVAKGAITFTIGHLGGIIIAAIGLLVATAVDKKIDAKYRKSILVDLKNELKMVEEKLEDARSDGARDKKYQLMRIQQKLKADIERIEYNLK